MYMLCELTYIRTYAAFQELICVYIYKLHVCMHICNVCIQCFCEGLCLYVFTKFYTASLYFILLYYMHIFMYVRIHVL
jgi:hypothetical protein